MRPSKTPATDSAAPTAAKPAAAGLKIGDKAPPFQVAGWYDQNGKTTAPDFEGKVVVIQFHSNAPNRYADENRTLRESLKLFENRNVVFVNLYNHSTDPAAAAKFMKDYHLPWKFAIDTPIDGKSKHFAGNTFDAFESPWGTTTIVVDAAGKVDFAFRHTEQSRYAVKRADQLADQQN